MRLRKQRDIFHERRKGADILVTLMRGFGLIGWLGLFAALLIFDKAQPEKSFIDARFLERLGFSVNLRNSWDFDLFQYIFYLMVMGLVLSLAGLFVHSKRNRRGDDGFGLYLIMLGLISVAGIVTYLWIL